MLHNQKKKKEQHEATEAGTLFKVVVESMIRGEEDAKKEV